MKRTWYLLVPAATLLLAGAVMAAPTGAKKAVKENSRPLTADELYIKGATLAATGEVDAAEQVANKGLKDYPRAQGFHLILGDVHLKRKQFADAYFQWQWEFLRSGPTSSSGTLAIKRTQNLFDSQRGPEIDDCRRVDAAMQQVLKEPKKALETLQSIEQTRGHHFSLSMLIAEAHQASGDLKAAEETYRNLLLEDPNFVAAYVQLAGVLEKQGSKTEAEQLVAKARSIDPENWRLKPQ